MRLRVVDGLYEAPSDFRIEFIPTPEDDPHFDAGVVGNRMLISYDFIESLPGEAAPSFIHEMTHLVQAYPSVEPLWVTEGIADWATWDAGFPRDGGGPEPRCDRDSRFTHYLDGYECAAAFLGWLDENFAFLDVWQTPRLRLIPYLNAIYHRGHTVSPEFVVEFYTSGPATTADLWQQCLASACAGGRLTA